MKTPSFFAAATFAAALFASPAGAVNLAPGATYSQDFNSLGSSASASLPSGWSATASTTVRAVTSTEFAAAGTTTARAGTGTGTNAGIYNWGDAADEDDRGVGFLASGSAAKTGNLYLSLTATGYIPDFTVSYDVKCYRNNSNGYRFQLYYSTDAGANWTSAGNDFLTAPATASSGGVVNPAGVTSVSLKSLDVALASGETIILCWSYSVPSGSTTSNAQGLGIDNVEIAASQSSGPSPLAAPSFEPVQDGDATAGGFTLRWMAVENAAGYEIVVTNVADQMEAGFQVSYSGPNLPDDPIVAATISGLDADTVYAVAVRALATTDPSSPSTDYVDSDWSSPVEIATTLAGGLRRATLFDETFDSITMTTATAWSGSGAIANTDEPDWTFVSNAIRAPMGMRLGTAKGTGLATTREIAVSNNLASTSVVLSFLAASYTGEETAGLVTLIDGATGTETAIIALDPDPMTNGAKEPLAGGTFYNETITVPARFALRFESLASASDHRLLLDSIKVTQVYDPNYAVLLAPSDVAGSAVGTHGFTVSWTGVEHAEGYEVLLDGAVAGSCAAAATSLALTGLADGTTYSVQVRALGDGLHYGDSPLSTAISVTTDEDAQSVVFAVAGAPAGDVYAGDAVSFTVAATYEATGAAAPVTFSGITGATFSNGAFSWTPAEADVGPHTATFASGAYSTNISITVMSAFATVALAETENFSQIKSTSWTSTSGYTNEIVGDIGAWTGHDLIKTKSAVLFGRGDSSGTVVSPAIELRVRTPGSFSVSFDTGAISNKSASVQAQILDAGTGTVLYTTNFPSIARLPLDATAVADAGARFTVAPDASVALPAAVKLSLTTYTSEGVDWLRAYLDTVVFSQTVSAKMRDLAAPTGLALDGAAGETGFSFAWTAVAGATNYAVRVLDAAGAVVFSAPFCAAAQAAVSGLADDAAYTAQVRATGDAALWFDSPWSEALAVRTKHAALHPTLSFGRWANGPDDGLLHAGMANAAAVSATLDDGTTPVAVAYAGCTPAPVVAPTFKGGVLSWRPADDDTNKVFALSFEMTPAEGVAYVTNVECTVRTAPPLEPPAITVASVGVKKVSASWDPEPQFRATGYLVRLWRGSADYTRPGVCYEDFFDYALPAGWFGIGTPGTKWYTSKQNADARVQFSETGDALVSELHSAPVTSLSFQVKLNGSAGSTWTLYASTGGTNETAWVEIGGAGVSTETRSFFFQKESNYRRFKWVFTKNGGNMGLGNIAAEHEGAGAAFVAGYGSAAAAADWGASKTLACETLRAGTEYFLEVTVTDGSSTASSVVRFSTLPAPKGLVIVFK